MATDIWNYNERRILGRLQTPAKIQAYLDDLKYNTADITRSPREVMRLGRAHCFDGALFGAAALEHSGEPPLVMYLTSSADDDDHVLALFKRAGCWGALAKSNYTGCRHRDPVYRSLRELTMSYFDTYFNLSGKKTLRGYSLPFDLRRVKDLDWRRTAQDVDFLDKRIKNTREFRLLTRHQERLLAPADPRSYRAATLGLDKQGAFQVKNSRI